MSESHSAAVRRVLSENKHEAMTAARVCELVGDGHPADSVSALLSQFAKDGIVKREKDDSSGKVMVAYRWVGMDKPTRAYEPKAKEPKVSPELTKALNVLTASKPAEPEKKKPGRQPKAAMDDGDQELEISVVDVRVKLRRGGSSIDLDASDLDRLGALQHSISAIA